MLNIITRPCCNELQCSPRVVFIVGVDLLKKSAAAVQVPLSQKHREETLKSADVFVRAQETKNTSKNERAIGLVQARTIHK